MLRPHWVLSRPGCSPQDPTLTGIGTLLPATVTGTVSLLPAHSHQHPCSCHSGCFHMSCPIDDGSCSAGPELTQAAEQTFSPQGALEAPHQPSASLPLSFHGQPPHSLKTPPPILEQMQSLACWVAVCDSLPFVGFLQPLLNPPSGGGMGLNPCQPVARYQPAANPRSVWALFLW